MEYVPIFDCGKLACRFVEQRRGIIMTNDHQSKAKRETKNGKTQHGS